VSDPLLLLALAAAVILAILALMMLLRRPQPATAPDSPYGASTEGEKRCPKCSMGNLWTDRTCISCGARLPG
jgi:hypothetical protein